MGLSSIQWTDVTDNVIVVVDEAGDRRGWWCLKISPGCANCYAEGINGSSYYGGNGLPYTGTPPTLKLREDIIDGWARQTKAKKHFVMSMSDVFGAWVPQAWIFRILDGMRAAAKQTFQVLTKRADVMLREVLAWLKARGLERVPANIWLGVSVENQQFANVRIPLLLQIPCDVRWLSCEPLLERIDLRGVDAEAAGHKGLFQINVLNGRQSDMLRPYHDAPGKVAWVVVGGEGRGGRRCNVAWVRSIVTQCESAGVATFVKQLGANVIDRNDAGFEGDLETWVDGPDAGRWTNPSAWPHQHAAEDRVMPLTSQCWQGDPVRVRLRSRKGGDWNEWPYDLRIRQFPEVAHAA